MSAADRLVAAGWTLGSDGFWRKGVLRATTLAAERLEAGETGVVRDRRDGTLRERRRPGRRGGGRRERAVWVRDEVWARWKAEAREAGVGVGVWLEGRVGLGED